MPNANHKHWIFDKVVQKKISYFDKKKIVFFFYKIISHVTNLSIERKKHPLNIW
jgi:hypothetical protein